MASGYGKGRLCVGVESAAGRLKKDCVSKGPLRQVLQSADERDKHIFLVLNVVRAMEELRKTRGVASLTLWWPHGRRFVRTVVLI